MNSVIDRPLSSDGTARAADVLRGLKQTLGRSASFQQLAPAQQQKMERDLARIMTYLTDPAAGQPHLVAVAKRVPPVARAQGVAAESADVLRKYVDAVDFPKFVKSLIDGVFNSIVEASIRQMHEYGKFLEGVVKSVNEFAQDHVTLDEARDFLVEKNPASLKLNTKGDGIEVIDEDKLPDFKSQLGIQAEIDVGDEQGQRQLVEAAQLKLARMRQQQLASMVLLGINRIVVTDGLINAKVVFDVKGVETTHHEDTASSWNYQREQQAKYQSQRSFWGTSRSSDSQVMTKVSSSSSSATNTADSNLEAKAKLTGEVRINFKSETFPLEKLASPAELTSIEDKTKKSS